MPVDKLLIEDVCIYRTHVVYIHNVSATNQESVPEDMVNIHERSDTGLIGGVLLCITVCLKQKYRGMFEKFMKEWSQH